MAINRMLDKDVRQAVKQKIIKGHINDPSTLVVEELGVNHGINRIDIAVINGEIHGYELKSDSDNLRRLPKQVDAYSPLMDKVTLVVGQKHAQKATLIIPDWWGIKVATQGLNGAIYIDTVRRDKKNYQIIPIELLKLLWKEEAIELLSKRVDVDWKIKKMNKKGVYNLIIDTFTIDELKDNVRAILKSRSSWRVD